ncbi:MAG TPA: phosphomethylpyrimidine synthase ThiC [Candidatus Goldiibacteriota bacterium]|nr:phosphomethylpyrimidine synthase ThiC [Candidatus Goldiibacteriota bacterium]
MTQLEAAKKGVITDEMKEAAAAENIPEKELLSLIASGEVVLPFNKNHKNTRSVAIGRKMRVKVNANIGSSADVCDLNTELLKLKTAVEAGADAVMDLSTGGDISSIRREIIKNSPVPIGTVPIYQVMVEVIKDRKMMHKMTADDLFSAIEQQAMEGVDFVTVHCGITRHSVDALRSQGRLLDIVSRGGSMLAVWIIKNNKENPLFSDYDRLLDIAYKYDLTLSLGDGMRPGCLADATDRAQIQELITLGSLARRAYEKNVQVMIEGPGHVPLNEIETNMKIQKKLCNNAPFYVLGPLVTDIAPGYDHITSAIGGALAGYHGADFLCYVTPAEHLKLPDVNDVREGVIVSRIAAHAADIAKGYPGAIARDNEMAKARKNLDWDSQLKLAIDPEKARKMRESCMPNDSEVCTMCGELCAIRELKNAVSNL